MTSRERVKAAMDLKVPDRIPLMCQLSIGHMLVQLGVPPVEFWHDLELFADGLVKLRAQYDFDGILVSLHGHDLDWRTSIASREMSPDGELVTFTDGHSMLYPPDDLPRPPHMDILPDSRTKRVIGDLPETLDYIPVSGGLHFSISPEHRFDIFTLIRKKAGPEYSVHGEVTSPFDYFLDRYGYQDGLVKLIDDPDESKRVLSHFAQLVAGLASDMCSEDIDAIKVSSPFAGGGFISPDFYKEFVLPYEAVIVQAVRKHGVHIYMHTCGAIGDRINLMFESGITGLECLDPPPLGTVELAEAKDLTSGRGFIKGNIDSVNTLLLRGPQAIMDDAEDRIKTGKRGGGFILSTACSVAPHVPREHLRLLHEAVERWG